MLYISIKYLSRKDNFSLIINQCDSRFPFCCPIHLLCLHTQSCKGYIGINLSVHMSCKRNSSLTDEILHSSCIQPLGMCIGCA